MTKIAASQHKEILALYEAGKTRRELAVALGVTYRRICQIVQPQVDTADRKASRGASAWGMSLVDFDAHVGEYGDARTHASPMQRYIQHRANADKRGIEWQFDFVSWWRTWLESGKWNERAPGVGYVMARRNDGDTPYSPSTVYICISAQNTIDSFVNLPPSKRAYGVGQAPGSGLGYAVDKKGGNKPYIASFRNKTLGTFATTDLARAAYLTAAEEYKGTQP